MESGKDARTCSVYPGTAEGQATTRGNFPNRQKAPLKQGAIYHSDFEEAMDILTSRRDSATCDSNHLAAGGLQVLYLDDIEQRVQ